VYVPFGISRLIAALLSIFILAEECQPNKSAPHSHSTKYPPFMELHELLRVLQCLKSLISKIGPNVKEAFHSIAENDMQRHIRLRGNIAYVVLIIQPFIVNIFWPFTADSIGHKLFLPDFYPSNDQFLFVHWQRACKVILPPGIETRRHDLDIRP